MFILGLTGSIGMGKTVAATDFRRQGLPVHDSDAAVHALMASGGAAVERIGAAFPGVVRDGAVDRAELGKRVFGDDQALELLEAIVHPLVRKSTHAFLGQRARLKTPAVVLDIPLLFETGAEDRCDAVCVVSAPYREQRRRVLSRPGMTEERFEGILEHQIPDHLKRRAADFVVFTGLGRSHSLPMIRRIATIARTTQGAHWPPF
jgi:dephospho-CoA kinase